MAESSDNLFHVTTDDGLDIDVNASDIVSGFLTAQNKAITNFAASIGNSSGLLKSFGLVGVAAGAVISAWENNTQGLSVSSNFEKTALDLLAGYSFAEGGATLGAILGGFFPPIGPVILSPVGAVIGGIAGGIFSNNVYPLIQEQLLASNQAGDVQAHWAAGLPYTLTSTTPGVPSVNFYANGQVSVPSLGVTINPGGSVTTSTGTIYYQNAGASPNFSSTFVPNDGSASTPLSGQFTTDNQGNVGLGLQTTDTNGIPVTSGLLNLTASPSNPVQESFDTSTQSTYVTLVNPDPTQGWGSVTLRFNGTVVTQEVVTDRALNQFTFGYDGNGAVDVETITQFGTPTTAIYDSTPSTSSPGRPPRSCSVGANQSPRTTSIATAPCSRTTSTPTDNSPPTRSIQQMSALWKTSSTPLATRPISHTTSR